MHIDSTIFKHFGDPTRRPNVLHPIEPRVHVKPRNKAGKPCQVVSSDTQICKELLVNSCQILKNAEKTKEISPFFCFLHQKMFDSGTSNQS